MRDVCGIALKLIKKKLNFVYMNPLNNIKHRKYTSMHILCNTVHTFSIGVLHFCVARILERKHIYVGRIPFPEKKPIISDTYTYISTRVNKFYSYYLLRKLLLMAMYLNLLSIYIIRTYY